MACHVPAYLELIQMCSVVVVENFSTVEVKWLMWSSSNHYNPKNWAEHKLGAVQGDPIICAQGAEYHFVLIVVISVYSVYNSQLVDFDSDVVPLDNKIEFIRIDASARITSTMLFQEMLLMNYIDSVSGWKAWKHDGGSVTFLLGPCVGELWTILLGIILYRFGVGFIYTSRVSE